MTREEEYILKELNQNYEVRTDAHSFSILEKSSDKWLTVNTFRKNLSDIFMKTCYPILDVWYDEKSTALIKELNDYIVKIDFSKAPSGSLVDKLIKEVKKSKKMRDKYNESFIKTIFFDYHKKHNINPKLEELAPTMKSSSDISSIVAEFIEMEPVNIRNYIIDYLNDWYTTKHLGEKLTDFFRQLVVTMGERNWRVTWIGHGELTKDKLKQVFIDESESIFKIIVKRYQRWYDDEVIEATEKKINKNLVF